MARPKAVVIRAWAIPSETTYGLSIPIFPSMSKEKMMPVTVPKIPNRGDRVMMVSRIIRFLLISLMIFSDAASMAPSME